MLQEDTYGSPELTLSNCFQKLKSVSAACREAMAVAVSQGWIDAATGALPMPRSCVQFYNCSDLASCVYDSRNIGWHANQQASNNSAIIHAGLKQSLPEHTALSPCE